MHATLASRDVDCCLIPESPFYLKGKGGLFEFVEKRLKENRHMVIIIAEGAGQDLVTASLESMNQNDASGNKLLQNVGLWISHRMKDHFASLHKMPINLKTCIDSMLIVHAGKLFLSADPTYMIRAIPCNASQNVYCTLLVHSAIHGAMARFMGFTVGPVNGSHAYNPFDMSSAKNKVVITDRMWARLLSSTKQPSFLSSTDVGEDEESPRQLVDGQNGKETGIITGTENTVA